MNHKSDITFHPAGQTITADVGSTLLDAALDNDIDLPHECGGNCSCTTCHVTILSGGNHLSPIEEPEAYRLQFAEDRTPESRLACQALLQGGPIIVEIRGS